MCMTSKVLPLKAAIAASHVPETVLLCCIRADQVPRQLLVDFRADQVPSSTTWLLSLTRDQEPLAAFLASGRTRANQCPRRNRLGPAVAIQLPCQVDVPCGATHQEGSNKVTPKPHFFCEITPWTSPQFMLQSYLPIRPMSVKPI